MSNTARKMNEATAPKYPQIVKPFPSAVKTDEPKRSRLSVWLFRRAVDIGVITMAASQRKRNWEANPTNVLGWLGVIAMFCTFAWFIYQRGIEHGKDTQKIDQLTEDVKRAQTTGDKAIQLAKPEAESAGHTNTNTEKK